MLKICIASLAVILLDSAPVLSQDLFRNGKKTVFKVDYAKIAEVWHKEQPGLDSAGLLDQIEAPNFYQKDLVRFQISTPKDAVEITRKNWFESSGNTLAKNELLIVTDLRSWRYPDDKIDDLYSYAWCVSWLLIDGQLACPRIKNRIWIDAESGSIRPMRSKVIQREVPYAPPPDGDLLQIFRDKQGVRESLESRLHNSRIPLPSTVVKWELEQRNLPRPNYSNAPFVHKLIALAGDDEDFGKDGDLVWIVHHGPRSHEFRGEQWFNSRNEMTRSFSTENWTKVTSVIED